MITGNYVYTPAAQGTYSAPSSRSSQQSAGSARPFAQMTEDLKQKINQWSKAAQSMGYDRAKLCTGEDLVPVYEGSSHDILVNAADPAAVARADALTPKLQAQKPVPSTEELLERLSDSSLDILRRIKDGKDITTTQWDLLCGELRDQGAITQYDYDYTRGNSHLIPVGGMGPNSFFVPYERIPGMAEKLQKLAKYMESPSSALENYLNDDWQGDPLAYLDGWMTELRDWRDYLSVQREPDGGMKYPNLRPIIDQINDCQKVSNLIKDLIAQ